jgi:hypothetical protein
MTAGIIPFPPARRGSLVASIARRALELSPTAGEQHIQHSLKVQVIVMRRKGVAENLIERERVGLESAVRARIWNAVMRPHGSR